MKIPESPAYYGNEENGQWQPNGVILDVGVGGGVVGSGDAGLALPAYPPARGHTDPGYMMAGYYHGYPPHPSHPAAHPAHPGQHTGDDFSDYMWMENEDEFDKQVMQQLEEEALMEQCIEAMLEDEQRERGERGERRRKANGEHATTSNGPQLSLEERLARSTLNPLAAEFVPTFTPRPPADTVPEVCKEAPAAVATVETASDKPSDRTDDAAPEVSADAIDAAAVSKAKEQSKAKEKRTEKRKPEVRPAKSDSKVPAKKEAKKEVKSSKSETRVEAAEVDVIEDTFPALEPAKGVPADEAPSGPKPINYAAAAKANKPKKASSPPAVDKPAAPAPAKPTEPKPVKNTDKPPAKEKAKTTDKVRKNSTK